VREEDVEAFLLLASKRLLVREELLLDLSSPEPSAAAAASRKTIVTRKCQRPSSVVIPRLLGALTSRNLPDSICFLRTGR
jgi:hypothetical protein